ncbi:hypothetical protein Pla110_11730 [Polystyrenella longa]|uniref:Uncharacterized protein n=1 Tax=Polystyrenella longa TaxID=2528007 RepID=A0A518CJQ6_9PLAN|nr:hypothetical protein [Polystyrenella longa]QDU79463.1 hypothetical protein Pla110_11730 [Polystyrenella longa]
MAPMRSILPALLLTSILMTICLLMTGCARTFNVASSSGDEFSTERLLSMAETFESQGDHQRANSLYKAVELRDPSKSYLSDKAAPASTLKSGFKTGLNYTSPQLPSASAPASASKLTTKASDEVLSKAESIADSVMTVEQIETVDTETFNPLEVHAPFNSSELAELESTEQSSETQSLEAFLSKHQTQDEFSEVEIPIFESETKAISQEENHDEFVTAAGSEMEREANPFVTEDHFAETQFRAEAENDIDFAMPPRTVNYEELENPSMIEKDFFETPSTKAKPEESRIDFALNETKTELKAPMSGNVPVQERKTQPRPVSNEGFMLPSVRR